MSGGTLVWLTDNELELLLAWRKGRTVDGTTLGEDDRLYEKLEAVREEVACRVPGAGRTLARDMEGGRRVG